MVDGQVGFHRPDNVRRTQVEKNNSIVNQINKTKTERHPDLFEIQQDRMREIQIEKKEERKQMDKQKKLLDLQRKQEKEERSYDRIMSTDEMTSNAGMYCVKTNFFSFLNPHSCLHCLDSK